MQSATCSRARLVVTIGKRIILFILEVRVHVTVYLLQGIAESIVFCFVGNQSSSCKPLYYGPIGKELMLDGSIFCSQIARSSPLMKRAEM